MMVHGATKNFFGKRVQDVIWSEPGTPSLEDSVLDLCEMRRVVRVSVDHDFHAAVAGQAKMNIVEVEPVRKRIQLHCHLLLMRGLQHRLKIKRVGLTA